jgi:hypothetical protein
MIPESALLDVTLALAAERQQRRATRLRVVSLFRRAQIMILVAWLNQALLPLMALLPEPWRAVPTINLDTMVAELGVHHYAAGYKNLPRKALVPSPLKGKETGRGGVPRKITSEPSGRQYSSIRIWCPYLQQWLSMPESPLLLSHDVQRDAVGDPHSRFPLVWRDYHLHLLLLSSSQGLYQGIS